jgi:hypothetical protein
LLRLTPHRSFDFDRTHSLDQADPCGLRRIDHLISTGLNRSIKLTSAADAASIT